jgi:hypothetical protein
MVIHWFLLTKINYFARELAEIDQLFSYTSTYELQDPDPERKFRIRQNCPDLSGSATLVSSGIKDFLQESCPVTMLRSNLLAIALKNIKFKAKKQLILQKTIRGYLCSIHSNYLLPIISLRKN